MLFCPNYFVQGVKCLYVILILFTLSNGLGFYIACNSALTAPSSVCIMFSKFRKTEEKKEGEVCLYSNFGFCKFQKNCRMINLTEVCENLSECKDVDECQKRSLKKDAEDLHHTKGADFKQIVPINTRQVERIMKGIRSRLNFITLRRWWLHHPANWKKLISLNRL